MPPAEPPRRGKLPSVREETAPGAIHEPSTRSTTNTVSTVPPPPPDRRPFPHSTLVGVRVPSVEKTVVGLSPVQQAPPPRPKLDSQEISTETLLAELAAKGQEARAAEAEAERLRAELAAAKRPVVEPAVPPDAPTRAQWNTLLYKLGGAALAILLPCGAYLAYRVETLVPRVSHAESKQDTQQKTTTTVEDRVKALEKYSRAHVKWEHCVNAERDSAIERGTGHKVESEHDDVPWVEENAPPLKLRLVWATAPWSIEKGGSCGAEPAPPHSPTE